MKRGIVLLACLALIAFACVAEGQEAKKSGETKAAGTPPAKGSDATKGSDAAKGCDAAKMNRQNATSDAAYVPVHVYDPTRNADLDIQAAVAEAQRTKKRVMLEVGGLWCIWCRIMDEFFEKHPDLLAFREKNFVMVKINMSEENKNAEVLSRYPKVSGYPHIFVLDGEGKLLHSQDTAELEEGKGYNLDKFSEFLKQWSPTPGEAVQK